MRVVIVEDQALLRGASSRSCASRASMSWRRPRTAPAAAHASCHKADAAILDVRLPPGFSDEGLAGPALEARARQPGQACSSSPSIVEPVYTPSCWSPARPGRLPAQGAGAMCARSVDAVDRVAPRGRARPRGVASSCARARAIRARRRSRAHPGRARGPRLMPRGRSKRPRSPRHGGHAGASRSTSPTSSQARPVARPRRSPARAGRALAYLRAT